RYFDARERHRGGSKDRRKGGCATRDHADRLGGRRQRHRRIGGWRGRLYPQRDRIGPPHLCGKKRGGRRFLRVAQSHLASPVRRQGKADAERAGLPFGTGKAHPSTRSQRDEQPRSRRKARDFGEDGEVPYDADHGKAQSKKPGRGKPAGPEGMGIRPEIKWPLDCLLDWKQTIRLRPNTVMKTLSAKANSTKFPAATRLEASGRNTG